MELSQGNSLREWCRRAEYPCRLVPMQPPQVSAYVQFLQYPDTFCRALSVFLCLTKACIFPIFYCYYSGSAFTMARSASIAALYVFMYSSKPFTSSGSGCITMPFSPLNTLSERYFSKGSPSALFTI